MATKGGHKTEDARKRAAKRRGDESAAGGGGAKAMEARKGVSSANILCTICRVSARRRDCVRSLSAPGEGVWVQ